MTMDQVWERIEAALAERFPELLATLNPGASEEAIVASEAALGIRFPDDFRLSVKRHDGQGAFRRLMGVGPLLPLEGIVVQWQVWKELLDDGTFEDDGEPFESMPHPGVKPDWWNARWIPITHDGSGNHDCLDLDPADGGSSGQVIEMWHDDDIRPLNAPSLTAWLTEFLEELEAGELVLTDEYGLVHQDELDDAESIEE